MAQILSDGAVVPSYLGTASRGVGPDSDSILNDFAFRLGEVKKIIWPDDPLSYNKKVPEYEIEVHYKEGGVYTTGTYRGATVSTVFGGTADRFMATMRPDSNPSGKQAAFGDGSKVLVLCLSGNQQQAIILGGIDDINDKRIEKKEDGHHLFWEFNGLRFAIDKEGQTTLTFRGATKADGSLSDKAVKEAEGTNVFFDKNGSVKIATPDDAQFVKIDHENKKIEILADKQWSVTVNDKMDINVQNAIEVNSSGSTVSVGAASNVVIKSAGVLVGDATDAWVKGTTYRNSESQMHTQMMSTLNGIQALIATAATNLQVGSALNAVPLVGGTLASPPFSAASAALQAAGPLFAALAGFIATFEGQGITYLSPKNKTD